MAESGVTLQSYEVLLRSCLLLLFQSFIKMTLHSRLTDFPSHLMSQSKLRHDMHRAGFIKREASFTVSFLFLLLLQLCPWIPSSTTFSRVYIILHLSLFYVSHLCPLPDKILWVDSTMLPLIHNSWLIAAIQDSDSIMKNIANMTPNPCHAEPGNLGRQILEDNK